MVTSREAFVPAVIFSGKIVASVTPEPEINTPVIVISDVPVFITSAINEVEVRKDTLLIFSSSALIEFLLIEIKQTKDAPIKAPTTRTTR